MKAEKKQIPMVTRAAQFAPDTMDTEARTVELVWTTGAQVRRYSWMDGDFIEELAVDKKSVRMDRLNNGAPFLDVHNQYETRAVLGVVEKAWIANGEGRAVVRFSKRAEVDPIFQDIKDGILRNISVGYKTHKVEKGNFKDGLPIVRAIDWEPFEISLVPVGADAKAGFRSNEENNSCEIVDLSDDLINKVKQEEETRSMKTETVTQTETKTEVEKPADTAAVSTEATRNEATTAERKRVSEILEVCAKAKTAEDVTKRYLESGTTIEQVRKEIIDNMKTTDKIDSTVRVEAGAQDESMTRKEGMEEALLSRSNPAQFKVTDKSRQFIGMSLLRMAEEVIGSAKARGLNRSSLAKRALSTGDFVEVLANVSNKTLRRGYELQPRTFAPFITPGTLTDYKPAKRIAFGEMSNLEKVLEGEEYEQGTIGESAESISLGKYGKIIKITEEMIVNDDLNAFSRIAQLSGAASARLESKLVYNDVLLANPLMADGFALFSSQHGNLPTAAAITVASLGIAKALMRKQKGVDGLDYLDLEPAVLICGPDKETEARQVLFGQMLATQTSNANIFANSMQLVVDSRITGNKWFLSASPSIIDTIELAMMEGMNGPELSQEAEFNGDFIKFKTKHIAAAKAIDYRGLVYNAGA